MSTMHSARVRVGTRVASLDGPAGSGRFLARLGRVVWTDWRETGQVAHVRWDDGSTDVFLDSAFGDSGEGDAGVYLLDEGIAA